MKFGVTSLPATKLFRSAASLGLCCVACIFAAPAIARPWPAGSIGSGAVRAHMGFPDVLGIAVAYSGGTAVVSEFGLEGGAFRAAAGWSVTIPVDPGDAWQYDWQVLQIGLYYGTHAALIERCCDPSWQLGGTAATMVRGTREVWRGFGIELWGKVGATTAFDGRYNGLPMMQIGVGVWR